MFPRRRAQERPLPRVEDALAGGLLNDATRLAGGTDPRWWARRPYGRWPTRRLPGAPWHVRRSPRTPSRDPVEADSAGCAGGPGPGVYGRLMGMRRRARRRGLMVGAAAGAAVAHHRGRGEEEQPPEDQSQY